ncbi:ATP-dependent zinc metalloprotease FtsH [Dehalobacterium formicoaceticum]|uniref:ATP-dependent zinc metalloprotease FtsH n=1 Tax=Dehalobacterium formicoaceticum TaxID=51515 RepID=A0ABT1Y485_9FIRM|nr:ATP-dependent zinc metalloprotease FtsH [Dehalobacterium formicoaceticum]MCR6545311.1 ATP-dependent zinc metalloprotease FtsH [Dehalobacterium formicoaceticum]
MNRVFKNLAIYVLIVLIAVSFYQMTAPPAEEVGKLTYDEFMAKVGNGEVKEVSILAGEHRYAIEGILKNEEKFTTTAAPAPELLGILEGQGVKVNFDEEPGPPWWTGILSALLPILLLVGLFFFMMQQTQGGGNRVMQFGKSRAKLHTDEKKKVTFADVAGVDEVKEELEEIVEFLKSPRKFSQLGAKIPKGVLLFGPPGTGKTLLARAVAGEAGVPFFSISGSDFVEMFVGVGASRVRDLFEQAKKNAPCIVFIDEIDAVGRQRGAGLGGGHDEREQTLNQLLVEMDGFAANEGIIVVAATNRPDILDPALLRPGRFDRQITVNVPDILGRKEILQVHVKGKPLGKDVDLEVLARRTPGFTGADLANLLNEAALLAARRNKNEINMKDMEDAVERVIAGPEKKSRVISDYERKLVAYHEAGHAVIAYLLPNADPLHKVSIIPRGGAGGYTLLLPKEDRNYMTKSQMKDQVVMLLGGRMAEALVLKEVSTGAQNDLERATETVRRMITRYGMSEELGPLTFGNRHDQVFLGRDISQERNYSEAVAYSIDKEARRMIDEAYNKAKKMLTDNMDRLKAVAQTLMDKETLEAEEFAALMKSFDDPKEPPAKEGDSTPGEPLPVMFKLNFTWGNKE